MIASSFSPLSDFVLGGGYGHPVCLAAATTLVGLFLWLFTRLAKKATRKLPPGPRGLPLIGDVRHAIDHVWLSSSQRKREYGEFDRDFQAENTDAVGGEMMYVSALGQGILVLNSRRVAVDLLEKRSGIYSDRPHSIVLCDYMTEGLSLFSTPYNDLYDLESIYQVCTDPLCRLRRYRRASTDSFSKSGVSLFRPVQNREAMILALDLMKNPSDKGMYLRRHSLSIMLSINYDLPPAQSESDPLILVITDRTRHISHTLEPGAHLVELFPWLRYVPSLYGSRILLGFTL